MRTPSVARLVRVLGIPEDKAREVRAILATYDHGVLWSADEAGLTLKALARVDAVLGTHGVERIAGSAGSLRYCNTGDAYTPTVGRTWTRRRGWSQSWFLGDWGTLVETRAVIGRTE